MLKRIILLIFSNFNIILVVSAQYSFSQFDHIETKDGLSSISVTAILNDSYGYMWFGTYYGLNLFDGYEFKTFFKNDHDSSSISGNRIVDIFEDSKGNVWVSTYLYGLNRYDRKTGKFQRFMHNKSNSNSISSNSVSCVREDKDGKLWVGTINGGLNLFVNEEDGFTRFINNNTGNIKKANVICSMVIDDDNTIWISNNLGYLSSYKKNENKFETYIYDKHIEGEANSTLFGNLMNDEKDKIWIGTENGVYIFDKELKLFSQINTNTEPAKLNRNAVTSIVELNASKVLITTDHGGLNVYNRQTNKVDYITNNPYDNNSLANNQVLTSCKDKQGNVWLGLYNGGNSTYFEQKPKFQLYYPVPNTNSLNFWPVISLLHDSKNNVWIGTDGGGVNIFDTKTKRFEYLTHKEGKPNTISNNVITALHEDSNGIIWIGTYLGGLNKYNPNTGANVVIKAENPKAISHNSIWDIVEDKHGFIWIGTSNGLNRYNLKNHDFVQYKNDEGDPNSLSDNWVEKLMVDSEGMLWVGTNKEGLNLYNRTNDNFKIYKRINDDSTSLNDNHVNDIFEDHNGKIWISTSVGLCYFNKKENKFSDLSEKESLKGYNITDILEDDKSNLWFGTNKGLLKYNVANKTTSLYTVNDGLRSNIVTGANAFIDRDGKYYFATTKGFFTFFPDSVKENKHIPEIVITDFFIDDRKIKAGDEGSPLLNDINFTDTLFLAYNQRNFSFKYSALDYVNPLKNQYKYKLEGFEDNWHSVDGERKAKYTNIKHGHYIFHVKGANNDGLWNEKARNIHIIIAPPFWKTTWFILICIGSVLGTIFLIYKQRVKGIVKQKNLLENEVAIRTKELSETNVLLEEKHEEILIQKEQIENHRQDLEEKVEQRTLQLQKEKEKAEESDRLKSAFLANMSHEIRTPLNAIVGFSDLLCNTELSIDKKREFGNLVTSSSESLLVLINDILDFSKIESNKLEVKRNEFDLKEFLEEISQIWNIKCKQKNIEFKVKGDLFINSYIINSDKYRLNQILSNLLNNALKFTKQGYIMVEVNLEPTIISFSVKDTGIGIDPKNQDIIFERFRKVSEDIGQLYGGVGLGLSISRKIAEVLGGRLWVESELGKGAAFYLNIPL